MRCSTGLVSAVLSLTQRILLVDEPDSFLHPSLSRRVGQQLAKTARERDASLIAATHSVDFLFGCIQVDPEVRIVRLTYEKGSATARTIDPPAVLDLMRDPLLRSTNALRALFYRAVVVTEADTDRALYDEVNYRLTQTGDGIDDVLFLNAQNWQTIPRLVTPRRQMADYGLHFVPVGELECWLQNLVVRSNNKSSWLTQVFDALGSNPESETYVNPTSNDVWEFVRDVEVWIANPDRLGIPE